MYQLLYLTCWIWLVAILTESIQIFTTEHRFPTIVLYMDHHHHLNRLQDYPVSAVRNTSSQKPNPNKGKISDHLMPKSKKTLLARLHHEVKHKQDQDLYYRLRIVDHTHPNHSRTIRLKKLEIEDLVIKGISNEKGFQPIVSNSMDQSDGSVQVIEFFPIVGKHNGSSAENFTKIYSSENYRTFLLITMNVRTNSTWIYGLLDGHMMVMPRFHDETGKNHQIFLNGFKHISAMFDGVNRKPSDGIGKVLNIFRSIETIVRPWPKSYEIYPEITILMDHWTYVRHQSNLELCWRYSLLYIQLLDLLFFKQIRLDGQFELRLYLKQTVVLKDPLEFQREPPILGGSLTTDDNRNYLNALQALDGFGKWIFQSHYSFLSDVVLILTGQDLCLDHQNQLQSRQGNDSDQNRCAYSSIKGQAIVGGACHQHDQHLKRAVNLAVIEDDHLDGLHAMAHELGHLLGAVHDGEWPINDILGPGGRNCLNDHHPSQSVDVGTFIMSTDHGSAKPAKLEKSPTKWSRCSLEQFEHFFHLPRAMCLLNQPHL